MVECKKCGAYIKCHECKRWKTALANLRASLADRDEKIKKLNTKIKMLEEVIEEDNDNET